MNIQHKPRDNLSNHQRQILNNLKKRKDIVIKKADKGDTIVVETIENYIKDGMTHLSNATYYQRLQEDMNSQLNHAIKKFLNNAHHRGLIDKETYHFLLPSDSPRTPLIYFLKKLHKTPISVRPIVSHINSPTANISAFIDNLLKPIVKEINHILQNSKQLITEIPSLHLSNQTKLVTLDVVSLYPNIPIEESIQIILTFIEQHNNPTHPPICIINHLLRFVLNYNCFSFANLFFLQVHGIAMGTKLAPNYANLFMTDFENKHVFTWPKQPLYYRRYIDDIFLLWDYSSTDLDHFINHLNSVHPTIKFTSSISTTTSTYLDLDIYIQDNKIQTKTHFKTTNTFSYLHGNSNHPSSTFKGIFKGENIRILRNTSDEAQYNSTMNFLTDKFKQRQYPSQLTNNPPIPFSEREKFLSESNNQSRYSTNFITTYKSPLVSRTNLLEDWPRLSSHPDLREVFQDPPHITYKHSPNLSQLLVRAKLDTSITTTLPTHPPPSISTISFPAKNITCRNTQCGTCQQLTSHSHYSSHQTKQYFTIPDIYSCDTTHAIYLLDCSICGKQYIGETHNTIRNRMKHHRNMSKTALNRPIYAHLQSHQTDFLSFKLTIIDTEKDLILRKNKEQHYIKLLKTKIPFGLNVINPSS